MVFFRLDELSHIKNTSLEQNWPYRSQNMITEEPIKTTPRKMNLSKQNLPFGLKVYRPAGLVENQPIILSHKLAQKYDQKREDNLNKLESIKSLGDYEIEDTERNDSLQKVRKSRENSIPFVRRDSVQSPSSSPKRKRKLQFI